MDSSIETNVYEGKDLEAMCFAVAYHRWILKVFEPYLGNRLVEVGAGTGSFSELLLEREPESLTLIEPSSAMYAILVEEIQRRGAAGNVHFYNSLFTESAEQIKKTQNPDSILYVNVLEHISDDEAELRAVWSTLDSGGRVFIFVPAFQWLYGDFDKSVGHFRRYTKAELENTAKRAGFKILESRYFDVLGVLPWWFQYKVRRKTVLSPGSVKLYDRVGVPVTRSIESVGRPPFGKNLLLIGEK